MVMLGAFLGWDQTKPSALATAFFASGFGAPMETNWSGVGSAQQYQGSLRNGTPAWERADKLMCEAVNPAATCAAFQMRSNVASRDSFCCSAAAAISCTVSLRASRRGSAFFQG